GAPGLVTASTQPRSLLLQACGGRAEFVRVCKHLGQDQLLGRLPGKRFREGEQRLQACRVACHGQNRALRYRQLGQIELRLLAKNRRLQLPERSTGLDPQLLEEGAPRRSVRLESLRLATRTVEREHQLAAQALPQRLFANELLQLSYQLRVSAECEIDLDSLLQRGQP